MSSTFEQARASFGLGMQAFEAGRLPEAEQHLAATLALLPGRPSTLLNLAVVRLRLGRPADALPLLDELLAQDGAPFEAWGHRGTALAALGRGEEALAAFEHALALAPAMLAAQLQRALQLERLGRHADALAALDALLRDHPDDPEGLFRRGLALEALQRPLEALASYERLLALQPQAAAAWTQRGVILKDLGRLGEAADCFDRALNAGGDPVLNSYLRASVRAEGAVPESAPRPYVEGLFDGYADDFDRHLVERLAYRGPERLAALLPPGQRCATALDLGCGTGLMAPLLAPHVDALDGIDLSKRMLERARQRGGYRALHHADLTEWMAACTQRYGLVVAADVFIYVGALDAVFAGVARVLEPGGLFLFSVERADDGRDLELRPSSRYAHGHAALARLAERHGFDELRAEALDLRLDQGHPVPGLVLLLQRR